MRKFINWCNQNGGFISFIAIIVVIVIAIVPAISINLPQFLGFLSIVFLTMIKIPISVLVIILILLFITLRKSLPDWSKLFYKTVKNKVIDYISDQSTFFCKSNTYKYLVGNAASTEFKNGGYWNHLPQFNELTNSYWISHTKLISDDEAIKGGEYLFQKKIVVSRVTLIDSAMIYFVVDDKCRININGSEIGSFDSFDNLHSVNIKDHLKNGENIFDFHIYNNPGLVLSTAAYSNKIGTKGELNPYGIRYLIRIIYK